MDNVVGKIYQQLGKLLEKVGKFIGDRQWHGHLSQRLKSTRLLLM